MKIENPVIAAIYPHAEGYGYALVQGTKKLLDYGSPVIRPVSNEKCLQRIRSFIEQTSPDILVLRDESAKGFRGSERTEALLADIRSIAQDNDVYVINYSRRMVREAFAPHGESTKYGIAKKICQWLPTLEEYLPPKRKEWKAEHYRMGIFDAIALVYTSIHFNS